MASRSANHRPVAPVTRAGMRRLRDPATALPVLARAGRVSTAALAGFYPALEIWHDPVLATYALFTAIALGALSTVTGSPALRNRIMLGAGGVGLVLATAGTMAASSTAAACAGMFVIGFAVVLAGVAGPRVSGIASGLQLFYILASFPPYEPDTLPSRLGGVALGTVLLVAADRLLWPDPGPRPYPLRLADALSSIAASARTVRRGPTPPSGRPPATPRERPSSDCGWRTCP